MEKCSKCGIEKELTEFSKRSVSKDGLQNECKSCEKEYREANKDKIKEYLKEYREVNKDKIKEYREVNKDKIKEYREANKDKINAHERNRKATYPIFRLSCNIRSLISKNMKRKCFEKTSKTAFILGCDFITLQQYLDNNPYNFKFEDGLYDIDHIIPLSSATTEEEVIKLNHYTNLQLLPSTYNKYVKSDKDWDKNHFEEWLGNNWSW